MASASHKANFSCRISGVEKERDIVLPPIDATPEEVAQALFAKGPQPAEEQETPKKEEKNNDRG